MRLVPVAAIVADREPHRRLPLDQPGRATQDEELHHRAIGVMLDSENRDEGLATPSHGARGHEPAEPHGVTKVIPRGRSCRRHRT